MRVFGPDLIVPLQRNLEECEKFLQNLGCKPQFAILFFTRLLMYLSAPDHLYLPRGNTLHVLMSMFLLQMLHDQEQLDQETKDALKSSITEQPLTFKDVAAMVGISPDTLSKRQRVDQFPLVEKLLKDTGILERFLERVSSYIKIFAGNTHQPRKHMKEEEEIALKLAVSNSSSSVTRSGGFLFLCLLLSIGSKSVLMSPYFLAQDSTPERRILTTLTKRSMQYTWLVRVFACKFSLNAFAQVTEMKS